MRFPYNFTMNSATNFKRAAVLTAALLLLATQSYGDVCVWRDPDRTMQRIFPAARDYKTVIVKMTPDKIAAIEERLGAKLDDSEKGEISFYDIMGIEGGHPQKVGTIIALAGKGEYGVIEVVIGVDARGRIVGTYIQRSRERATHELESSQFLEQFKGRTEKDSFDVGAAIKPAGPNAEAASKIVAFVVHKMVLFYDVLREGGKV